MTLSKLPFLFLLKKRFTLESQSTTCTFSRTVFALVRLLRKLRRRLSSLTVSNSGAGDRYSTGSVETDIFRPPYDEDDDGSDGNEVNGKRIRCSSPQHLTLEGENGGKRINHWNETKSRYDLEKVRRSIMGWRLDFLEVVFVDRRSIGGSLCRSGCED
ncbi:hypothetical protein Tco_0478456 [Tanacetum coccineum]